MVNSSPLRRLCAAVMCTAVILIALPSAAFAHAQLLSTSPTANAVLAGEPGQVTFTFGESVGIDGQAVRVFNAGGQQVDAGTAFHPAGSGPTVGVRLKPGLPHGTYTATYRVVSADTHIVTGGFVFSIGAPSAAGGAVSLGHLLSRQTTGPVTDTAFAITRAVQFAAIGTGVGLFLFALLIWTPALRESGRPPQPASRFRHLLAGIAVLGILSAAAGIVLEASEGRGTDVWHAINASAVGDVLSARFGLVWGLGFVAWGLVLVGALADLRPRALTAVPLLALILLPAFAGHATLESPVALFAPANIIHVTAMSLWLGGLVGLLLDRSDVRTLAVALRRFSPLALGCVIALIVTGVVQTLIELNAWSQLWDTGYGRAILVKIAALVVLIGLGAVQRRRTMPAVTAAAAQTVPAPQAGTLVRRTICAELLSLVVVLAAVGSLAESAPGKDAADTGAPASAGAGGAPYSRQSMGAMPGMAMSNGAGGPAQLSTTLGPNTLELTVSPATVGRNTIALSLTAPSGQAFTGTVQLTVTATLPKLNIGPLNLAVRRTGDGTYAVTGVLGAPGRWTLQFTDRTSEFDETQKSIQVQIQ